MTDPNRSSSLSKRIAKNTILVLSGQVISLLANLAVTILMAGYLGGPGFGNFSYAIVLMSFFALLADFGMKPILVRELARQPERRAEIFGNAILIKVGLNALAMIAMCAAVVSCGETQLRPILLILTMLILLSAKLSTFRVVFEALFHAQLRVDLPIFCQALDSIILVVFTWALIHEQASLSALMLGYVFSNLPGFIITIVAAWRLVKPSFRINTQLGRALLRDSAPIFFYAALMTCYDRIDVILLKALRGENAVGLYAAAFRLVSPLNFIPMALVTSLFPLMSRYKLESMENLGKTYMFGIKLLITIGLPLALVATILGDKIIAALYASEFSPATPVFAILMWAQVFVFWNFFLVDFNTSIDRQKANFWVALFMCLANLGFDLLLIPRWEGIGASSAKLLTSIAGFGWLFYLSYQKNFGSLLYPTLRLLGVLFLFGGWLLVTQNLNWLVVLGLSLFVYPVILLLCGCFDSNERRLLLRAIERNA